MPAEMFYPGYPYRGQVGSPPARSYRRSATFRSHPSSNERISAHRILKTLLNRASRLLAQLLL
ncbi:hypothetical protein EMIT0162MI3_20643 [Pseudomonas chlororaphis]